MDNTKLEAAIEKYYAAEKGYPLASLLTEVIHARFLAPLSIPGGTVKQDGSISIPDTTQSAQLVALNRGEEQFYPIFTSESELLRGLESPAAEVTIGEYFSLIGNSASAGVVINPFGNSLVLNPHILSVCRQLLTQETP